MVIIGAMIGTDDLGQYILKSLSDKNGIDNGSMLGQCVAFMGLAVDHVIRPGRESSGCCWGWRSVWVTATVSRQSRRPPR